MRTEMTFLNPSKISLSLRLSSSFLICDVGRGLVLLLLRELRADWAASRVSSRAEGFVSRQTSMTRANRFKYRSPADLKFLI